MGLLTHEPGAFCWLTITDGYLLCCLTGSNDCSILLTHDYRMVLVYMLYCLIGSNNCHILLTYDYRWVLMYLLCSLFMLYNCCVLLTHDYRCLPGYLPTMVTQATADLRAHLVGGTSPIWHRSLPVDSHCTQYRASAGTDNGPEWGVVSGVK